MQLSPGRPTSAAFPQEEGTLIEVAGTQVKRAADRLNHRQCKVLGFRTPQEVFLGWKYATPNHHQLLHFVLESAFA